LPEHANELLFERKTVSKDHQLMAEALRHGRGKLDWIDLRGSYAFEISHGKLLQVGGNVATQISFERERCMVAAVDHGIHRYLASSQSFPFRFDRELAHPGFETLAGKTSSKWLS
jgi:hypothetical protein